MMMSVHWPLPIKTELLYGIIKNLKESCGLKKLKGIKIAQLFNSDPALKKSFSRKKTLIN